MTISAKPSSSREVMMHELASSLGEQKGSAQDFDPVQWLMGELGKAGKDASMDATLAKLSMQWAVNSNLNALIQESSVMIDSQSSQLMSSLPAITHDLASMKVDVKNGEDRLSKLIGELESKDKEEQRQTLLFISKVDAGKEKLQAARTALGEAYNWDKRIQELDSLLHSGEFTEFKGKMSEVKEALNGGLKMLPDYEDRCEQIEAMEVSLQREVRRKVGSAIDRCNPKQLRVCYDAYIDNSSVGEGKPLEEFNEAVCAAMNTVVQRKWNATMQSSSSTSGGNEEGMVEVLSESEEEGGDKDDDDGVTGFFHALAEALQERLETLASVPDGAGLLMRKCIYSAMKELFGPWAPSCNSLPDRPKRFLHSLMRGFNHLKRKMHFEEDEWERICSEKLLDSKLVESLVPGLFLPSEEAAGGGLGYPLSSEEEIEEEEKRRSTQSLGDGLISLETRVMKYQAAVLKSGTLQLESSLPADALAPLWVKEVDTLYGSFWYTTVNRSISSMVSKVFKTYTQQGDYNADLSTLLVNCRSINQSVQSLRAGAEEFNSQVESVAGKASERALRGEGEDASVVAILPCIGNTVADGDDDAAAAVDEVCQRVEKLIVEGLCSPISKRILRNYGSQSVWTRKEGSGMASQSVVMPSTPVTALSEHLFLYVPYLSKETEKGGGGDDVLRSQWVPAVFRRAAQAVISSVDGIDALTRPGLRQMNADLNYSLKIILSLWNGCRADEEMPEAEELRRWIHATDVLLDTTSSTAREKANEDPIVTKLSKALEAGNRPPPPPTR
ncbi:Coiled-coil domain-containing protein 12 [Perkinsus chesapeaki]|uniref:Conserved oligomeric Golgi complex subunit 7 n=1 Tax=Perkinsus chesapeaki TaxID=330153 RepID=A0A7J6M540_PERCH|nr:Coiled-coil domain-containing protein 12 [Perkinsus chesapeaki]